MNTHNAAGIEAAARLGAQRVTLARELSVLEIAHLAEVADGYGMEVESFAHGALCVCYSGQCFMSSLIGGRSANRGLCAQACRCPTRCTTWRCARTCPRRASICCPAALCAIDLLPELVEAGVTSFKIEGRMKSPEYVFAVTQTYRAVLDRTLAERAAGSGKDVRAAEDEHRTLAEAFSRGFTTAYLENQRGNDIMSYGRPNNRGVFVGRVTSAKNGVATVAAERPLAPGDVLEFWTNKGHFAYTLDQVSLDKQGNVRMAPDRPVGKGDRVFRVRSAEAAFEDDVFEPRVAVTGRVVLRIGQPLRVEFSLAPSAAARHPERSEAQPSEVEGSRAATAHTPPIGAAEGVAIEPARTKPVTVDDVRAHVDRLGQTPFLLESLEVELDEGVGIGFSQLHRVRAAALDDLAQQLLAPTRNRALPRVRERTALAPARPRGVRIAAWARILPAHARRSGQALTSSTCLRSTTSAARPWWWANVLPLQSKRAIRSRPSWRCQLLNTTRFRARARRPSTSILGATSSQASLCSWRIWPASCAPPSWDARSKYLAAHPHHESAIARSGRRAGSAPGVAVARAHAGPDRRHRRRCTG